MDVQQPPFSFRTCQKHTAAKHIRSKCPSKLLFWRHFYIWHMFTFYTYV